jgi:hypothetical protein
MDVKSALSTTSNASSTANESLVFSFDDALTLANNNTKTTTFTMTNDEINVLKTAVDQLRETNNALNMLNSKNNANKTKSSKSKAKPSEMKSSEAKPSDLYETIYIQLPMCFTKSKILDWANA